MQNTPSEQKETIPLNNNTKKKTNDAFICLVYIVETPLNSSHWWMG